MDADAVVAGGDPLAPDLTELAALSPEQLAPLLDWVLQFLIDAKGAEFQDRLQGYAATLKVGANALKKSVRALILFFQRGIVDAYSVLQ
jgi:hypothetical protein